MPCNLDMYMSTKRTRAKLWLESIWLLLNAGWTFLEFTRAGITCRARKDCGHANLETVKMHMKTTGGAMPKRTSAIHAWPMAHVRDFE